MLPRFTLSSSSVPGPLAALCLGLVCATTSAQTAPPGLVPVEGGRTKLGSTKDEVVELIRRHRSLAAAFAAEYPQHSVEVKDFYLMPTEVTFEQYGEFVRATGAKPPYTWCADIDAARAAHLEEQGRLKYEARQRGEDHDYIEWDPAAWWEENWETAEWDVPEGRADHPVNYVSYEDAQAYARWAGLRLMSEEEFVRAARGDEDHLYPWGDEWDADASNSQDYKQADDIVSVGSFEGRDGVYDLIGNVWEWTSSRYKKFDGYKPLEVDVSRGVKVQGMAPFDPSQRVIVGGAFVVPDYACRISVRVGKDRDNTTEALGFRCAASTDAAGDAAAAVLDEQVQRHLLPYRMDFAPNLAMALQRWQSRPGTSRVDGYRIITGFQRVLFVPVEEQLDVSSKGSLERWTKENGPLFLGVLSIPFPPMEPVMDGGTYYVAWRGAEKFEIPEDEEVPVNQRFWEADGFDAEVDCILFYDISGRPVTAIPAGPVAIERMEGGGSISVEPFVMPELEKDEPPPIPMDTLRFSLVLPAKSRKGLHTDVILKLEPGLVDQSWE